MPHDGMPHSPGIALITGAASGLGRQLARDLAGRGWAVAGLDRDRAGLQALAAEFGLAWAVADVADAASVARAVACLERELGPTDLLVACAGIAPDTPAVGMDPALIARVVTINLLGVSNAVAAVLPGMLARRRGRLVAVSSLASYWGLPGQMGYCASKAGLNSLMQSLWLDVKDRGVEVTTVCPGHLNTPQAAGAYHEGELMPVAEAARQVLLAIDRGKRFHAFPGGVALQLRLLRWLPAWLRERLLVWRMGKARRDHGEREAVVLPLSRRSATAA